MRMLCQFDRDMAMSANKITKQIFKGAAYLFYTEVTDAIQAIRSPSPGWAKFRDYIFIEPDAYINTSLRDSFIPRITEDSETYELFINLRKERDILKKDVRLINQFITLLETLHKKDRQALRNAIPDILCRFFNVEDLARTSPKNCLDKLSPEMKKTIEDKLNYYCSLSIFMEDKYGQVFESPDSRN